jgi:hypothetical protein
MMNFHKTFGSITQESRSILLALIFIIPSFMPSVAHPPGADGKHDDYGDHDADKDADNSLAVITTRGSTVVLPPGRDEEVFHFVVYGDRTGGVPEGIKVLQQAVVDTNLLDPDLVMTVGDLIQGYNEQPEWLLQMNEYKSVMSKLKMPWYRVNTIRITKSTLAHCGMHLNTNSLDSSCSIPMKAIRQQTRKVLRKDACNK